MSTTDGRWTDGVRIARAERLRTAKHGPAGTGRATAFDFFGTGGAQTWIGSVTLQPGGATGAHHHGRHEVVVYVAAGRSEIRWGETLEFVTVAEAGDFIYFAPYVPHWERNLSDTEAVEFVVVRSDNERIAIALDVVPAQQPTPISDLVSPM